MKLIQASDLKGEALRTLQQAWIDQWIAAYKPTLYIMGEHSIEYSDDTWLRVDTTGS